MKETYISDVNKTFGEGDEVRILGWIKSKRNLGGSVFLDIEDSSGNIQAVAKRHLLKNAIFNKIKKLVPESAVKIVGKVSLSPKGVKEILIKDVEIIGEANLTFTPHPRSEFNVFDPKYVDLILRNRHLFLRNRKIRAVLTFKHNFMNSLHKWFDEQGFIHIDAPILTKTLLYDENSAFKIDFFGDKLFLTQCVAFYLEAAVMAFEKVYNLSPSFRAERSRSRRHLAEFWHLKAEVAFANLKDMKKLSEKMLHDIISRTLEKSENELKILNIDINEDEFKPPYPEITYDEAIEILHSKGNKIEWGRSLGADEERILSSEFDKPFFVKDLPRSSQPFPFAIDSSNPNVTRAADLLAPRGYGEILGIAEKIDDKRVLLRRMKETGKTASEIERYAWYAELRDYGHVPHSGLGMGIERVIRWLLRLPHVRDAISFPRLYGRKPYP